MMKNQALISEKSEFDIFQKFLILKKKQHHRILYKYLRNSVEILDVYQDLLLDFIQNSKKENSTRLNFLDFEEAERDWYFNKCLKHAEGKRLQQMARESNNPRDDSVEEKKRVYKRMLDIDHAMEFFCPKDHDLSPEEIALKNERNQEVRDDINKALERLSEKQRMAFYYCKIEDKSVSDVSAIMGIAESTIRVHVHRANEMMRKYVIHKPDP